MGFKLGRREVRREGQEIPASSTYTTLVPVNIFIHDSSGGIEGLLDLGRSCSLLDLN